MVQVLLEKGATVDMVDGNGKTALIAAAKSEHAEIVKELLRAGAKVDSPGDGGGSALMAATVNLETLEVLLKAGANPFLGDEDGQTALHLAARRHQETFTRLLACGFSVDVSDNHGVTPLMVAVQSKNCFFPVSSWGLKLAR